MAATNESTPALVTIAGRKLETLWLAPPVANRPTIVMLHEGLGSIAMWKDFPARVAERTGCGVFLYSRYGHGRSDALAEPRDSTYLHYEAEIVLPNLLAQLGIGRPVLLGHSDGGAIAIIFAGQFPQAVRGLILEAPHEFVEPRGVVEIARVAEHYESSGLRSRLSRYHEHTDTMFHGWRDIWLDPTFLDWNIESSLDTISCPVLVVQGEDDEYGTTLQIDAITARLPQTQVLLLSKCGHSPHRDHSQAMLDAVAEFVAAL